METTYTGFYARFDTPSKKDAAVLLGADNLVGDLFDVEFVTEEGTAVAWMVNRFGNRVAFFDADTTRRLRVLHARDWKIKALLSFVAFTDSPEPGEYWGEAAVLCFSPEHEQAFNTFADNIAKRLMEESAPKSILASRVSSRILSEQRHLVARENSAPTTKKPGTVIMKGRRKMSEKLIEQGRKGNKGCYVVSWVFILAVVALALFGLKSCGVF